MARRPRFGDEPMSQLAVWCARLAWFALAVAALSVIIVRSGLLEIVPSLATFGAALVFAVMSILLGLASFVVIWRDGSSGLGRALTGIFVSLLLLAYPAYIGSRALKLPAIDDISTDTATPPRFDVLARLRPRGSNDYPQRNAELQRKAYPEIVPLMADADPKQVYDITLGLVNKHKWLVVDARPPAPRRDGTIELVARSLIMGFRDDVSIRIRPAGEGARVDIRSASRYGLHDFGANAQRIRGLLEEIDDAVSNAPEPRQTQPPQQPRRNQPGKPAPANKRS
ncbi:DUF1499 domain-containing protein [Pseudolabrys taiwanensis]|uniref:DUF1499 domain-containing protein n=1 Tax=Pseudolabrys taiwanensis TaxID=331696 RepID=A0A346A2N9_9HYPH|nr:DUF1499 domain-containing protein [Pseudolabrys taiwanensis]AXK83436.1 DUF1499 domain-containing protein [Pseudolabrys taiwanensis]